jgi:hypothetical protein
MPPRQELHSVQVIRVWLAKTATYQRLRRDNESSEPLARIPRARVMSVSEDGHEFEVSVQAWVRVPSGDADVWIGRLTVQAAFIASTELNAETVATFARRSGVYLLWPYCRVYLDQLANLSGVPIAPLPLLVRPEGQTVSLAR